MHNSTEFLNRYGPWAMVTGASSGIGAEFARELAQRGLSVIMIARREERLEQLGKEIEENYPVQTKVIVADLGTEEGCKQVVKAVEDIEIGLLINNAGVETYGSFFKDSLETHTNLININVTAVTMLTYNIGQKLAERGKGGIIFVSSMAAYLFPWFATYSASKAFVTALSVTLREEVGPKGVDILSLEPGVVTSEMSGRILDGVDMRKLGFQSMEARECVLSALTSLQAGKARETPGMMNKISLFLLGLLPQGVGLRCMRVAVESVMNAELRNG